MPENNFDLAKSDVVFEKRDIGEILSELEKVDDSKIAQEVLSWLDANVENFIDNHMKIFKINLVLDSSECMQETKKLQDLYRAIPDDDEKMSELDLEKLTKCRRTLDGITGKAHSNMVKNEEAMNKLFERMIFYYEKIIPDPENKSKALEIDEKIKELMEKKDKLKDEKCSDDVQKEISSKIGEGVKLLQFQKLNGKVTIPKFEYESFDVSVQIKDSKTKEVRKSYNIPEGFAVWVELSYGIKTRPTSMF